MKKERIGSMREYRICLNPHVRMCKCWDESLCPLKNDGVRYRGKPGTDAFRWMEGTNQQPTQSEKHDSFKVAQEFFAF